MLKQTYQNVTGTLNKATIKGTLRADEIKFTAGKTEYTAKVNGDTMSGTGQRLTVAQALIRFLAVQSVERDGVARPRGRSGHL